ncbi:hypothetical protein FIM07_01490, partial [SAR202 cluster bacterium AD-802-F09_MRT_200m]|nr:hypothetical protein [SAR202 cluster bacterium AD-802-F09_MRT_200m]
LLFNLAALLVEKDHIVFAVTSKRHAIEAIDDGSQQVTLTEGLKNLGVKFQISANANSDEKVHSLITEQTLGISLSAAWIFRPSFIERFNGRIVNLHGQRLPLNRGAGGFSWLILMRQRQGGRVIHLVNSGVDTGDIVGSRENTYPDWCRRPIDYDKVAIKENTSLLTEFVEQIEAEADFQLAKQDESLSTYWPRLHTETHGLIDWSWSLDNIENFICAFDEPYQGSSTFVGERKVFLKNCRSDRGAGPFHPFQVGIIYKKNDGALFVAVDGGGLVVHEVKDESGESVLDDLRLGDRFYTPQAELDRAMIYRAEYTPSGIKGT